jgi:DNA polymerase-3 subunit chi
MMQVSFYHVMNPDPQRSVCKLIEKIYNSGLALVVFVEQKIHAESLNKALWTFASKSFVPHGSIDDALPDQQPILITDNLNRALELKKADILMAYNSKIPTNAFLPQRLIYIFHDQDEESVTNAREEYKRLKGEDAELLYYKQEEDGSWVKF